MLFVAHEIDVTVILWSPIAGICGLKKSTRFLKGVRRTLFVGELKCYIEACKWGPVCPVCLCAGVQKKSLAETLKKQLKVV